MKVVCNYPKPNVKLLDKKMRPYLITFFTLLLITGSVSAKYGINFDELACYRSDISTLTSVFFKEELKEKIKEVKVRNSVTSEDLKFSYLDALKTTQKNNWLFIFTGIGSSSKSIHSKKLTYFIRESGFQGNILLIPSIFRADFIKSFSTTGIVGNIPQDASDLGMAMDQVIKKLQIKEDKVFSEIHYLGFSLGALTAAHLAKIMKTNERINRPRKVFLMNSPVDLFKSLSGLDKRSSHQVSLLENAAISRSFVSGQLQKTTQEKAQEIFCGLAQYEQRTVESFVAAKLVAMVGNVFYQGQRRTSTGFFEERLGKLPDFADRHEKRKYWRKAKIMASQLSFRDYVQYAVVPSVNSIQTPKDLSIDQINNVVSMQALKDTFSRYQKDFYIIHSTDDLLLSSPEEFAKYHSYFLPKNSFVVERGGHLGLLHNKKAISFIVDKL